MKKLTLITLGLVISAFSLQASAHSSHRHHYHKHGKVIYKSPHHKQVVKKKYINHRGETVIIKKVKHY